MKIGFDISQTGKLKAGCGYFADSLIRHLAEMDSENDYILYPTFGDLYWDPNWPSGTCQIHRPNFKRGFTHRTFAAAKFFWRHLPTNFEIRLGNPDILHSNNFYCPTGLHNARLVYTLYDLSFLIHPEWTTEQNRTGCFDGVFNASLYADLIVSISHYSRKHFLEIFPHYPADRIVVVYPASRFSTVSDTTNAQELSPLQRDQFWLNVGVREPRKNHQGLLQAYALLKASLGKTFPLVFAGGGGWLMDDFEKELDALNLRQDVVLLGYVDDEALRWLYQNCFAFIFPSYFEGFGLPVLEAMSLGAPIIASDVSSIPEIVGQAGVLIDPTIEEALSLAMHKIATDPGFRIDLKKKAIQQASQFSWKSAAGAVLQAYREILFRDRRFTEKMPGRN
jgi:glycosyltransferase involved in cell wall biosynthesis